MADTTPSLALPLIAAGQAQKHVTHNEALADLDALVQLACLDKDLAAPPATATEGDRYLVAAADPGGAWAGLSGRIACFRDGAWVGLAPRPGWLAWLVDEADLYSFTGTAWISFRATITALQLARLGVNAAADATNRLAVKADAALFSWDDATPGSGSLRLALNKKTVASDAALVFQTGYATRALLGTLGSDALSLKVSADGTAFATALVADPATGFVGLGGATAPAAPLHLLAGQAGPAATGAALRVEGYGGDAAGTVAPGGTLLALGARGVPAAPRPLRSADRLFGLLGAGYRADGAMSAPVAAIQAAAEEDFTATGNGTLVEVATTAAGATARRAVARFRGNGALELMPLAADPAAGTAQGQLCANSTAGALKWHNGTAWARITNFAKAAATTNFDNYVGAGTWTRVQFNVADANDQGAFVAASNRFVAPEAGLYAFDAALTYKRNGASAPTALEAQFYRNGAAAGRGRAAVTGALVDGVSALGLTTVLRLAAGDAVEVWARFTGADGYVAAANALFAGRQLP